MTEKDINVLIVIFFFSKMIQLVFSMANTLKLFFSKLFYFTSG